MNADRISKRRATPRRIEVLFVLADQIEARFSNAQAQLDALLPAVLDRAFKGELE